MNDKTKPQEDAGANARRADLAAADRSIDIEDLPPASAFARSMDQKYIDGKLTTGEIVDELKKHYRQPQ